MISNVVFGPHRIKWADFSCGTVRIVHISETFLPRLGGIETALDTLFRHTPDIDHLVLTNPYGQSAHSERFAANVRVERVPPDDGVLGHLAAVIPARKLRSKVVPALALAGHALREVGRRRRVRREAEVEVVHLHSAARARYFFNFDRKHNARLGAAIVDWWLDSDAYRAPILMTDHSLFGGPRAQFDATSAGEVVRRIDNIVCVERSGWENATAFAQERGLSTRIWQVPNPVDTNVFLERPMSDSRVLRVGYVGRADKLGVARVLALARAAPAWVQFRLALAGSPADLPDADGTPLRIDWNVPNSDLPAFYAGIHVFLDPWSFGAPRTALEALSSGRVIVRIRPDAQQAEDLPVSLSPIVGVDPMGVFGALRRLHEDRSELERLGRASRAHAVSTFDARLVADAYRGIYEVLGAG